MKTCKKCLIEKPLSEFRLKLDNRSNARYPTSWCKSCLQEALKMWRRKKSAERPDIKRHHYYASNPSMKVCTTCAVEKPRTEFYSDRSKRSGLSSRCKACDVKKAMAANKKNPERHYASVRKWHEKHPESRQASARKWRESNRETARRRSRNVNRRKLYGVSETDVLELARKQGGVCAICGEKNKTRAFSLDHCHKTKRVRGLLCQRCNILIGNLESFTHLLPACERYKNPERFRDAKLYNPDYKKRTSKTLRQRNWMTEEDVRELARKQGGACAICGEKKKLGIDHCHRTQRIRGLLCHGCNILVGYLETCRHLLPACKRYLGSTVNFNKCV